MSLCTCYIPSSVLSDANFLTRSSSPPPTEPPSSPAFLSPKDSTALALSLEGGPLTGGSPFSSNEETGPEAGPESCSIPARESWIVLRK